MVGDDEGKQGAQKGQKELQPCDELREVHGCCAQDGVDLIAKGPFQSVALQTVLTFHVPDDWLYRSPSFH